MPRDTTVIGTRDYTPTPEQIQRVKTFMQWLPLQKASGTVVIVPWQNFRDLAKSYGAQTTTALTNPDVDRTYINASVFDKGSPHTIEWVLAHEAAHLNSPNAGRFQEARDSEFDDAANKLIQQYNSPAGQAYQQEQSRIASDAGKIQPSQPPVQSNLVSALAPPPTNSVALGALRGLSQK